MGICLKMLRHQLHALWNYLYGCIVDPCLEVWSAMDDHFYSCDIQWKGCSNVGFKPVCFSEIDPYTVYVEIASLIDVLDFSSTTILRNGFWVEPELKGCFLTL